MRSSTNLDQDQACELNITKEYNLFSVKLILLIIKYQIFYLNPSSFPIFGLISMHQCSASITKGCLNSNYLNNDLKIENILVQDSFVLNEAFIITPNMIVQIMGLYQKLCMLRWIDYMMTKWLLVKHVQHQVVIMGGVFLVV